MKLYKFPFSYIANQDLNNIVRKRSAKRQSILYPAIMALFATSCSFGPDRQSGEIGAVVGFLGGAIAEEPRAAVVARDTLSAGGSAADAAVAAYFTMTASYPLGASLGAGGACLVYDSVSNQVRSLDFMPRAGKGGGPVAIPSAVRAMAILHATYGRLRWGQLVAPGERYARFGHSISRALARRMEIAGNAILADPGLQNLLGRKTEKQKLRLKAEGEKLSQLNLAAALSQIRAKGVAAFYGGTLGRQFVAASDQEGGKITLNDLRSYRPGWGNGQSFKSGNELVYSITTSVDRHGSMHELLRRFAAAGSNLGSLKAAEIAAELLQKSTATGSGQGGSAVAIIDRRGSAVACQFSLNGELGTGKLSRDLGFLMARSQTADGRVLPITPVLAVNQHTDQAFMALAASGGSKAIVAAARVATAVLQRGENLGAAQADLRALRFATDGQIFQEKQLSKTPAFGLVQAAFCPSGAKRAPASCAFETDPRGFGLAASAK